MASDLVSLRPVVFAAPPRRAQAALTLMVASGFAGLGYQIAWTQQSALWVGHEAVAVLAVIAAFFGGLALGSLALGPRIDRSTRPARWYAACEGLVALWSVAIAALMAPLGNALIAWTGVNPAPAWQWTVAFGGTFLMLLPATAAMGATLPAMERLMASWGGDGRAVGALYACNTLGAVVGVIATAFWLIPEAGLLRTAAFCAALNLACAATALALPAGQLQRPAPALESSRPHGLWTLALTGLLGIGYEVLVVRVISQVAEDTVYTFAILLAVYLVGTAIGAAVYARWLLPRGNDAARLGDRLLTLLAATCLFGTGSLWAAEAVREAVLHALGAGMAAALAAEVTLSLLAFGPPTLVMGALFAHLATQARGRGTSLGRALGVNTLGAAAAPLLIGVVLVPTVGPKATLLIVAGTYLAIDGARRFRSPAWLATAGGIVAVAVWAPPLAFVDVPEGGRVVLYREGASAAVSVVDDARGVSTLRINNRQQEGSSATVLSDARQAWLPLLLHPAPRRALFLGLGTGTTAASAAADASLQVDAVELLPEVVEASALFVRASDPTTSNARPNLLVADARRFVRTTPQRYDVIVSDNFHPARSGSGALYTVEHFRAVRERLNEGGVFCQWLPLHQLDLDTLRSIARSFLAVYPQATAVLATNSLDTPVVGLVARVGEARFGLAAARERLATSRVAPQLQALQFVDEFAVLGGYIAGPAALARFAGDAPLNTDDRPVVAYRAPRITYAPDSLPRERLSALLQQMSLEPADVIAGDGAASSQRLAAYWSARDRFIEVGQRVRPSADVRRMLEQVREPLLGVLRISPDFRPARDPLLRMANALERDDPAAAQSLTEAIRLTQRPRADGAGAINEKTGAADGPS